MACEALEAAMYAAENAMWDEFWDAAGALAVAGANGIMIEAAAAGTGATLGLGSPLLVGSLASGYVSFKFLQDEAGEYFAALSAYNDAREAWCACLDANQ